MSIALQDNTGERSKMHRTSRNVRSKDLLGEGRHAVGPSPDEMLQSVMDAIAESILEASDEEICEELYEEGRDPMTEAAAVRKMLLEAIHNYQQSGEDRQGPSATEPSNSRGRAEKPCANALKP